LGSPPTPQPPKPQSPIPIVDILIYFFNVLNTIEIIKFCYFHL